MGLNIEPIKAREAAATKGPWIADSHTIISGPSDDDLRMFIADTAPFGSEYRTQEDINNADFIAHAHTDITALIAEVEGLEKMLEEKEPATGPWNYDAPPTDGSLLLMEFPALDMFKTGHTAVMHWNENAKATYGKPTCWAQIVMNDIKNEPHTY